MGHVLSSKGDICIKQCQDRGTLWVEQLECLKYRSWICFWKGTFPVILACKLRFISGVKFVGILFFCNESLYCLYRIYPIKIKYLLSIFVCQNKCLGDKKQKEIECKTYCNEPSWRDFWYTSHSGSIALFTALAMEGKEEWGISCGLNLSCSK